MDGNVSYEVREMMFGTLEEFEYFKCGRCGCLQIKEIPENLNAYYPKDYYSFVGYSKYSKRARRGLKRWFDTMRLEYHITGRGLVGRLAALRVKPPKYIVWVRETGISRDSRILDVGCGSGKLLVKMSLAGFRQCTGIDQFIEKSVEYPGGVKVIRQDLSSLAEDTEEKFDLVMFHHSYEHVPDPYSTLQAAARLITPGGWILMEIPLSDSEAWETYRERWVQLDAPRHLYLHTRRSMELLAAHAGLCIKKVVYDSSEFQFLGSELYTRGVPLTAAKKKKLTNFFNKREIQAFKERAKEVNNLGRGDQATFFMVRKECNP